MVNRGDFKSLTGALAVARQALPGAACRVRPDHGASGDFESGHGAAVAVCGVTGSAVVTSDYVFRGMSQTRGNPAVQGTPRDKIVRPRFAGSGTWKF